ncbi:MAG: putative branched-chain amino acid transport ATP-binding protein LivG [Candidatus Heimdallarchaeota archaeon LC_3]|nr:MAG: putative branched-chain amino acid transport ATP-binding protein LivG [Candidatus Heimdallarchaeota archaeon LC_3]
MEKEPHLIAQDIHKYFVGVKALEGASVTVTKGKLTALIGPNGSGKTTLFNIITGWLQKTDTEDESSNKDIGFVEFEDKRIDGLESHEIALKHLLRTFQTTRNWGKLTVLENLLVAPSKQTGESFFNVFLKRKKIKEEERKNTIKALEILDFLEITHIRDQLSNELSGGQLKLLAMGRLLMAIPKILLLDEPLAGVNPTLANKIMDKIVELKKQTTIFLIEHNMDIVFNYSDEIWVMARGKVIAEGTPQEVENNRVVIEAYLGADY